jgi:glycosyltransferase involved in cell wall biosynthesis
VTGNKSISLRQRLKAIRNHPSLGRLLDTWRGARRIYKSTGSPDYRVASLEPEGAPRGRVLLSYKVGALFDPGLPFTHTQYWESAAMAQVWRDLGFGVDVVDNDVPHYVPRRPYDVLVASRLRLEALARRLDPSCFKVLHVDTAHWLFNNTATHQRALDVQRRKGVSLTRLLELDRNHAIEAADCATVLGNEFTSSTYAYAGKPMHRVPISTFRCFDWPEGRDFAAAARRFVWFGSRGAVHKGLDLVLEAFAGMPDLHLTVAGPIAEQDFEDAYRTELYETSNIRALGWIDLGGAALSDLARESAAVVFPSCAEGGSGSVIAAMHAGLIPVVSREAGVNVRPSFGLTLPGCSVEEIRNAVRAIASRSPTELEAMARESWAFARANHTREQFVAEYTKVAAEIANSLADRH